MPKNFEHLGGLSAYEILGVEPTATTEEIEGAYRAAIKRQHSDKGGVTRLAQLVNDARDALIKDRPSYDAWLKVGPRVTESGSNRGPAASTSQRANSAWVGPDDVPGYAWDPWETARRSPPPPKRSGPQSQPRAATKPDKDTTAPLAEERRTPHRRRLSARTVVAIVLGGMSVLSLVSLAIAIPLGLFKDSITTTSGADPTVMKQGQVVVTPGTKVVLDDEGTSFVPVGGHVSFAGTDAGLLFKDGTSYVALAQQPAEGYGTCSALTYPEPTDTPIAWNRLTVGSELCVNTSYSETTKSLITVVGRSGRSATLKIITWND
jgi:hypothetical protein